MLLKDHVAKDISTGFILLYERGGKKQLETKNSLFMPVDSLFSSKNA